MNLFTEPAGARLYLIYAELSSLDVSIYIIRDVWLVFFYHHVVYIYKYIPVLNAKSVDPGQTPRSVASDLGLHCLPMSHLWDARLKWVNVAFSRITTESGCDWELNAKHIV